MEKAKLMWSLMKMGEKIGLGFLELHPIVALILNETIKSEEDLKIVFNSTTKEK